MSKKKLVIALDAMGGDNAPLAVIEGAYKALINLQSTKSDFTLEYQIFGDQQVIAPLVNQWSELKAISMIIHSERKVEADEKPSQALRNSKNTSMGMAINAVKEQQVHAAVSSGNTGALMAIAKVALRTLPGIDRPAIIGILPTIAQKIVMLDLGANAECDSANLVQFAIMGDAFAKVILDKENPSIGLLNIGSEDNKGNDMVKSAAQELYNQKCLNFVGYVESDDIAKAVVDVVVADGFTGNVALKMAEGTAYLCKTLLENAFKSSWLAKIGYLLAKTALKKTFKQIDARYYNGAMFIGLNGVVVKSHGGADSLAFANAIGVAIELSRHDINQKIIQEINSLQQSIISN